MCERYNALEISSDLQFLIDKGASSYMIEWVSLKSQGRDFEEGKEYDIGDDLPGRGEGRVPSFSSQVNDGEKKSE